MSMGAAAGCPPMGGAIEQGVANEVGDFASRPSAHSPETSVFVNNLAKWNRTCERGLSAGTNSKCHYVRLQPQTVWCTRQGNIELMPKKEVLDFEVAPGERVQLTFLLLQRGVNVRTLAD
jgi:hypothetical protein